MTMGCVEVWSTAFSVCVALASLECSVRLTLMAVWEWTVLEMVSVQCEYGMCVCVCVCVQGPQFKGIISLKVNSGTY